MGARLPRPSTLTRGVAAPMKEAMLGEMAVLRQCFEPFVERTPRDVVLFVSLLAEGLGAHVVGKRF